MVTQSEVAVGVDEMIVAIEGDLSSVGVVATLSKNFPLESDGSYAGKWQITGTYTQGPTYTLADWEYDETDGHGNPSLLMQVGTSTGEQQHPDPGNWVWAGDSEYAIFVNLPSMLLKLPLPMGELDEENHTVTFQNYD